MVSCKIHQDIGWRMYAAFVFVMIVPIIHYSLSAWKNRVQQLPGGYHHWYFWLQSLHAANLARRNTFVKFVLGCPLLSQMIWSKLKNKLLGRWYQTVDCNFDNESGTVFSWASEFRERNVSIIAVVVICPFRSVHVTISQRLFLFYMQV